MKIAIDARLYGLENAGLGRYIMNVLDQLKKVDTENNYNVILREKYFYQLNFPENWKKVLLDERHYSLKEQIMLPKILYEIGADLVHFPHFNAPILFRGKYVVTIHDMLMHKQKGLSATTLPWFLYYLKRLFYKFVFRTAVKKSNMIITPSNTVKDELLDYYKIDKDKVKSIYLGINKIFFNSNKEKSSDKILDKYPLLAGKYFIYSGNAYPHKNLNRAIDAFNEFNITADKDYQFALLSSNKVFTDRLKKYIKDNNLNNIKILGFVPDEEYKILLNNSLAYLYPSLSEGFGLPGLEAISSNTLLVASDIKIFREIFENTAIYFDPNNTQSIANALFEAHKLSEDKTKLTKVKKENLKFIEKYDWEVTAKKTLEVYESIVR